MFKIWEIAFDFVIHVEGEYSDDPEDPGGETKFGITVNTARKYGYEGDMKDLTLEHAKSIYFKGWWNKLRCPAFENDILKILLFDTGVNMGKETAALKLQKAYNILHKPYAEITVDGLIGPQTIRECNQYEHPRDLNFWFMMIRGERYADIVRSRESQTKFIRGWGRRLQKLLLKIIMEKVGSNSPLSEDRKKVLDSARTISDITGIEVDTILEFVNNKIEEV